MAMDKNTLIENVLKTPGTSGTYAADHTRDVIGVSLAVPHSNLGATRHFGGKSRQQTAAPNTGQAL